MSVPLPHPVRALLFVAWGNCWLSQACSLDDAAQETSGHDLPHRVDGTPWGDDAGLTVILGRLAEAGVHGLRLALPVPGDLSGLGGPPEFNVAAVTAGEAVLLHGAAAGLIPRISVQPEGPAAVRWIWQQAVDHRLDLPSDTEAAGQFRSTMREAAQTLARLDVAGMSRETEEQLAELRRFGPAPLPLPKTFPSPHRGLLQQAWWLAAVLDLAQRDSGTALSAGELEHRADALRAVTAATRHAVVAAVNSTAPRGADPPRGAR